MVSTISPQVVEVDLDSLDGVTFERMDDDSGRAVAASVCRGSAAHLSGLRVGCVVTAAAFENEDGEIGDLLGASDDDLVKMPPHLSQLPTRCHLK